MRDAIKTRFPDEAWVFDRQVDGGSSRKRPDVRLERITYSLLAECDEHQHPTAQYPCENRRTMELFTDLGNRMLVEVRLNPDAYTGSDGVRHPSCFTTTGASGLRVNTVEWALRLDVFLTRLQFHMDTMPSQEVTREYLFYNGYCRCRCNVLGGTTSGAVS